MIIGIHQPDFFPWLGVFDKINRSDIFVYLDHVINNPRDSLWTKRVQIIVNSSAFWLTIPLVRPKNKIFLPINQMEISKKLNIEKQLRTIIQSYKNAPFFSEVIPLILDFYRDDEPLISKRNIKFIENVCKNLGINTKRVISSEYNFKGKGTELLINIIKYFGGDSYLHGKGGFNYQKEERFYEEKIKLIYQDFKHPKYYQFNNKGKFIEGLSIIDALMNIGFEGVRELINIS